MQGPKAIINNTPYDLDCPQVINYGPYNTRSIDLSDIDPILSAKYSYNSLIIANAYGIIMELTDLERLIILEQNTGSRDSLRIAVLEKEKEIDKVLDMAVLELESYENFPELTTCPGPSMF